MPYKFSFSGVFTNPCDQVSSYVDYFHVFHVSNTGDTIELEDNTLLYTPAPEAVDPYTQPLTPDENGYAQCPACKENVQWTELNILSDARFGFKNDKTSYEAGTTPSYHFRLSNDLAH